jgi:hypothetical protein
MSLHSATITGHSIAGEHTKTKQTSNFKSNAVMIDEFCYSSLSLDSIYVKITPLSVLRTRVLGGLIVAKDHRRVVQMDIGDTYVTGC